jgi:hypothetical protein
LWLDSEFSDGSFFVYGTDVLEVEAGKEEIAFKLGLVHFEHTSSLDNGVDFFNVSALDFNSMTIFIANRI